MSPRSAELSHGDQDEPCGPLLGKSELERDYLDRICHVDPQKMSIAALPSSKPLCERVPRHSATWLVFFTEPYQSYGWRADEVYRDLLPRLCALAQACRLRLVFKLHPFESIKGHRRMLRRLIPEHEPQIEVLAGPPSDQLWNNTRLALTVQSSTASECAALGIPVFLCAWLRDPHSGYVRQYAQFGVGHVLESSEQRQEIPSLLASQQEESFQQQATRCAMRPDDFAHLLSAAYSLPIVASSA